jgi:hypothetical protein
MTDRTTVRAGGLLGGSPASGVADTPASVLDRLAQAVQAAQDAQTDVDALVREARSVGLSWSAVAKCLGVSRQAAWSRYSPV